MIHDTGVIIVRFQRILKLLTLTISASQVPTTHTPVAYAQPNNRTADPYSPHADTWSVERALSSWQRMRQKRDVIWHAQRAECLVNL